MKKLFYSFIVTLIVAAFSATQVAAQYNIISYTPGFTIDTTSLGISCSSPSYTVNISGYAPSLTLKTFYGDGTNSISPVTSPGSAIWAHTYSAHGVYSVKNVLLFAGNPIDSIYYTCFQNGCETFNFNFYNDINGNCAHDWWSGEGYLMTPITIAVDKNGVFIDTISCFSGFAYSPYGNPGDIFGFHVIHGSFFSVTCPVSGVLYDTLSAISGDYAAKEFAFSCTGITGFDASEIVSATAGRHAFISNILVADLYCTPTPIVLTMNMNPKYNFIDADPPPSSVSGHILTWNFPTSAVFMPQCIYVHGEVPGTWLVPGDTVHSSYYLTPLAGDSDTSNNTVVIVDTVTGSWDPNDKAVSPTGYIAAGAETKLTYTLRFENTGNDKAFNIHIMDTLSDDLNARTLEILGSSAVMNIALMNNGVHNIVKFDFPAINLLDSSHHGQCDGMVRFTIKTNAGLPDGTHIDNRAGIYFDFNEVVMTNTVTNIVGSPAGISEMSNSAIADVSIFPNPANSELTVNISKGSFSKVSIVNSLGQQVLLQDVNGASTKLNIKALPAGTYYISVRGESGVKTQMFQKM